MLGKVLLLEDIHPIAKEKFQEGGFEVESLKHSPSEKELYNRIKDVSILGIRSKTNISEEFLNYAGNLLALGAYCIGTNQINIPECSKRGVCVFNDPISNTRSVAELAMGEIIMLLRGIFNKSISLHKGIWNKSSENSVEVRGKNLGIIGYGKIGSQLSTIAESLGMNVYYYDLQRKVNYGNAKKCNSLEDLFGISDIVTLHVDGNKNNRGFFGKREFEMMKDKSYFLNLSRGFVVDEKALAEYLDKGKILGAAIDVFETEPSSNNNLFKSVLQNKKMLY
jgi:D-3-phosphoglycerate dehydrogenase